MNKNILKLFSILSLLNLATTECTKNKFCVLKNLENQMKKIKQLPIIFDSEYDIKMNGIEERHPFDTAKYGKVAEHLKENCPKIKASGFISPSKKTDNQTLKKVHTKDYLDSLNDSTVIARIAEVPQLAQIPNKLLQTHLLDRMRLATEGTIEGAELALKHHWAIHLSGGYHHAKSDEGGGFCYFADIPLAIKLLRKNNPDLKVLVVDLDAHQGNGIEMILKDDSKSFVFDIYGKDNYPYDLKARKYIDFNYPVKQYIKDEEYLKLLKKELPKALNEVKPDLIIYNAGTDIFEEDLIGKMSITAEGIKERDEIVFRLAVEKDIPILMVLSGGYSPKSAEIISKSLENIGKKILKFC